MSDWGDESTEGNGRGFGGSSSNYKTNDDGNEDGGERRFGGGGRGRGGSRGRGGRGGGGGYGSGGGGGGGFGGGGGYGDRNGDDDENGESNELQDIEMIENRNKINTQKNIKYIPNDYKNQETVEKFLDEQFPVLWTKANLLEIMAIHHYVVMAFKYHLELELGKIDSNKIGKSKMLAATTANKQQKDDPLNREMSLKIEFMRHFDAFKCSTEDDNDTPPLRIPADYLQELQRTESSEDVNPNPLESVFRDTNLLNLAELPTLKATKLPQLFDSTASKDLGGASDVASDSSDNAELSVCRRPAVSAPRKRFTDVAARIAQKQQARTKSPAPNPFVLIKKPLNDRMHLRERQARQSFPRIAADESAAATNFNERTAAYCYFPLHWPLTRLEPRTDTTIVVDMTSTLENNDYSLSVNLARQNITSSFANRMHEATSPPPPPPQPLAASLDQSNELNLIFNEAETVHFSNEFDITTQTERAAATAASFGITTEPSLILREPSALQLTTTSASLPNEDEAASLSQLEGTNRTTAEISAGTSQPLTISTPLDLYQNVDNNALLSQPPTAGTGENVLWSIPEESDFRNLMLRRTIRQSDLSSTPLTRRTHLGITPYIDAAVHELQQITETSAEAMRKSTPVSILQSSPVKNQPELPPVSEELERNEPEISASQPALIEPSSEINLRESRACTMINFDAVQAEREQHLDEYRKDWYEILRDRNLELKYEDGQPEKRKKRRRQPTAMVEEQQQPTLNLAPFLPYLQTPPPSPQRAPLQEAPLLDNVEDVETVENAVVVQDAVEHFGVAAAASLSPSPFVLGHSPNSPLHQPNATAALALLQNVESTIGDWFRILMEHKGAANKPYYYYSPSVLVGIPAASTKRIQIKLTVLQEIIKAKSFNITKLAALNTGMQRAIAYSYLLELCGAGMITLSADGRNVSLK